MYDVDTHAKLFKTALKTFAAIVRDPEARKQEEFPECHLPTIPLPHRINFLAFINLVQTLPIQLLTMAKPHPPLTLPSNNISKAQTKLPASFLSPTGPTTTTASLSLSSLISLLSVSALCLGVLKPLVWNSLDSLASASTASSS